MCPKMNRCETDEILNRKQLIGIRQHDDVAHGIAKRVVALPREALRNWPNAFGIVVFIASAFIKTFCKGAFDHHCDLGQGVALIVRR